ncbi:hypothetical protein L0337_10520, partial [candidate division KSB1 bacterium]|nr:hypothetical protein [candidate division KSB1 bacterium]
HKLTDWQQWLSRQGVRYIPGAGWQWAVSQDKQNAIMRGIRDEIIPHRGARVRWQDIPDFPEREISSELYDLDSPETIDKLYKEMAESIGRLNEKAARDKAPDHPLTQILRARQKIELLKVPIFCELADDFRAKGFSVVFFVNFRQTVDELRKRRGVKPFIDGSPEGVRDRQYWIDEFQANRECELIANNDAGGIGISLHDLTGEHPRVGLVSPGFSAEKMRQVFGRLHRAGGRTPAHYRLILAARTVEASVHRRLRAKLNNLDALNDADFMPENLPLSKASLLGTI